MKIKVISTVPEYDPNINAHEIEVQGKDVDPDYDDGQMLNVKDTFSDIVSSGAIGYIEEDEWKVNEIENLFSAMTTEQKHAVFVALIEEMSKEEYWYVQDISFLKRQSGIESFQAVFSE